ncbi:MAG: hypothetical protein JW708_12360, partial [Vallitaleaceae bacterium]|nr:hypothetical protein [Vallitaleaceae bacterium]
NREKVLEKPCFRKYELDHIEKVSYLEQRITTAKKHRFDMKENLALHMFYLRYLMADQLYYHDEKEIFIVAKLEEGELKISHIYMQEEIPVLELAIQLVYDVFWEAYSKELFSQISFSFIPKETNELERRIYKEDDSTLFVLTRDGNSVFDNEKLMFPIITHT